ncbi:protein charybde-like [Oratosquilla oratoria]|uniref:protein charybde-like n=1 Tax=Oratosquilla oratoria TaxID=337810 RepID=UPI003F7760E6
MAHLKVLLPTASTLSELLGPLPVEEDLSLAPIEDPSEAITRAVLRNRLEEELCGGFGTDLLVLPPSLLDSVADHVWFLSKDEPCGLRGCMLIVEWESDNEGHMLTQVEADSQTPTTFELYLTLRPDPNSWFTKMAKIFRSLGKRKVVVSPKYELLKKRLYAMEE